MYNEVLYEFQTYNAIASDVYAIVFEHRHTMYVQPISFGSLRKALYCNILIIVHVYSKRDPFAFSHPIFVCV